ncbi:hypothetical protein [Methylobacterium oryzihabitans]|uniref:hypothetical protein n=1 Tax=Methylobacterium oryzihabitans TaxID=2499852 RepID=UPI0016523D53|nr:hypothetical protein [Methylobacterium oryzihabitans]
MVWFAIGAVLGAGGGLAGALREPAPERRLLRDVGAGIVFGLVALGTPLWVVAHLV